MLSISAQIEFKNLTCVTMVTKKKKKGRKDKLIANKK